MRILHLSYYDRKGGACIAAYRQHQALRAAGVDSVMWVRHKVTNDPHVFEYRPQSDLCSRIQRIARRQWLSSQKARARPMGEIFDDRSEHDGRELHELPPHAGGYGHFGGTVTQGSCGHNIGTTVSLGFPVELNVVGLASHRINHSLHLLEAVGEQNYVISVDFVVQQVGGAVFVGCFEADP